MKKNAISALLFAILILLPVLVTILYTNYGSSHAAEEQSLKSDDFLKRSPNELEILFFGYAGCDEVCPTTLARLSSLIDSKGFKNLPARTGVLFVDVKGGESKIAHDYATGFSENMRSYTPNFETFRKLSEEFILRIYKNRDRIGRISHTDHLFILRKMGNKWIIKRVLKNDVGNKSLLKILHNEAQSI